MNPEPSSGRRVARVAIVLAVLSLAGKMVGMLREVVVADAFGAGAVLDAFLVGFTVPDMLSFVALYVALNLFVPVYLELRERDGDDADRFAAAFITRSAVLLWGLSVVLAWSARPLVDWLAPALSAEHRHIAVLTLRVLSVMLIFRGLQGAYQGLLNARRRFVLPMIASLSVSGVVILALLLFESRYGVFALIGGVLAGNALPVFLLIAAAAAIPGLRRSGWRHPAVGRITRRLPWVVAIELLGLSLPLVDRFFAGRGLDDGAISALNFARILYEVPFHAVALTVAVALFPELATWAARDDRARFRELLIQGVRGVSAVLVPVALLFVVLHEPLVRAVFERGAFDAGDSRLTGSAFWAYAVGLPFTGAAALLFQAAYAAGRFRLLLGARLASLAAKVAASALLMPSLGVVGLALGTALYQLVLVAFLARPLAGTFRGLWPRPGALALCSVGAAAAAWLLVRGLAWAGVDPGGILGQAIAWLGAGAVYVTCARVTGLAEVRAAGQMLKHRLRRP